MASASYPGAQAGGAIDTSRKSLSFSRIGSSVQVGSGSELVNSLRVRLSGLVVRDQMFLTDVRWRGRAARVWGGKRLVAHARALARVTYFLYNSLTFKFIVLLSEIIICSLEIFF